jgi:hypothetical protein
MLNKRNFIEPIIGENTIVSYLFCVPSVPLWLSYGALAWLRSVFEEDSKFMGKHMPLAHMSVLAPEVGLVASRTYV